jgi:hypothetical protein
VAQAQSVIGAKMSKLSLASLANLQNDTTATTKINTNSSSTVTAMENTLSRDGTSPNQMGANLDMNNYTILNLPAPNAPTNPVRLQDLSSLIGGGIIVDPLPVGGTTGQVLFKNSNANYDTVWQSPTAFTQYQTLINQTLIDATSSGSTIYVASTATIQAITLTSKTINFVFLPGAAITVDGTITFETCDHGVINGNNAIFTWAGNATDPMVVLSRSQYMSFEKMQIICSSSAPLHTAFRTMSTLTGQVSHGHRFIDILVQSNSNPNGLKYGWVIGYNGASNGNNDDEHIFQRCVVNNYDKAAYAIQQPESKSHRFYDCVFVASSSGLNGVTTESGNGGDGGGSFYWMGGGGGANTDVDFALGPADDLILISDLDVESSKRLVRTGQSASPWPLHIRNCRIATDALSSDGKLIDYEDRGPLIVENCIISNDLNRNVAFNLSASGRVQGISIGNNITSNLANPHTTDDTSKGRWLVYGTNVAVGTGGSLPDPVPMPMIIPVLTFAEVSAITVKGAICQITDSTTGTSGATITGGGSTDVLGRYNGTNWVVVA